MKNFLLTCVTLTLLLAGCNEKPAPTEAPTPQTSADQAMQAAKQEAQAAADSAKQAASEAAAAAKDAAAAAEVKTRQASTEARQATDKAVAASKETAAKAVTAAKEATHEAATATENAAQQVAASTAGPPTTIPDWVTMPTYDCRACHAIDHKVVGPAWKDVAEKYKDDPGAEKKLMDKVRKGGKGNWDKVTGGVAMPPHPTLSDAELKRVVDFVLSLAK